MIFTFIVMLILFIAILLIWVFAQNRRKQTKQSFLGKHSLGAYSVQIQPAKAIKLILFDIDDTLTNIPPVTLSELLNDIPDEIDMGILTASNRSILMFSHNDFLAPWLHPKLLSKLEKGLWKNLNTMVYTRGEERVFPPFQQGVKFFGRKKGWQLKQTAMDLNLAEEEILFFDDNATVIEGAKEFAPNVRYELVDNSSTNLNLHLTNNRILNLLFCTK